MKVFFDTNVLIATFATRGLCADLFAHVLLEHEIVIGEVVLEELRDKLRKKIKLPKRTIDEIEALLSESTVVKKPKKPSDSGSLIQTTSGSLRPPLQAVRTYS